jgi:surface protein
MRAPAGHFFFWRFTRKAKAMAEVTDIANIPAWVLRLVAHFVAQDGATSLVAFRSSGRHMRDAAETVALAHAMRAAPRQTLSTRRLLLALKDDPELAKSFVGASTHSPVILSRLVDLSKAVTSAASSRSLTQEQKDSVRAVAVQLIESARGQLLESLKRATVNGAPMYEEHERLAGEVIERLKGGGYPPITYEKGQWGPSENHLGAEVQEFVGSARYQRAQCNYGPLCLWDVSAVTDLYYSCATNPPFSSDLYWNTSQATCMSGVFHSNTEFKGDLSTWDVSNVKKTDSMFSESGIQNSGIAYWNTASLQDASHMFSHSSLLPEVDLSKWNTKNCEDMRHMFAKTAIVDSGIGRWNVSAAKTDYMLRGTRFSGIFENWPAKQHADAVNGVLSRFGTTSRLTRFGTAELLDLRSVFADLARAKSAQRAESAEGEERSSEGCTLM